MAFQLKNQNDIKIFILYLLMNVPRPLSYNELNDIVVQDELVSGKILKGTRKLIHINTVFGFRYSGGIR